MTTFPFSRAGLGQAIQRLTGFRGDPHFSTDMQISPTIQMADLLRTPFMGEFGRLVTGRHDQAAVAAEYSYIWVKPEPGILLQILKANFSAAARLSPISATAITTVVSGSNNQAVVVSTGDMQDDAGSSGVRTGTAIHAGTHGVNLGINALILAAGWMDFPDPGVILDGDKPGGYAFITTAVNTALDVSIVAREWRKI